MYKFEKDHQIAFTDFNQPAGLKLDMDNRWVKLAEVIPWTELEVKYAALFPSPRGNVALPFRTALASVLIQQKFGYIDEELVQQITENPYLQYFIGMYGFSNEKPFAPRQLTRFRRRVEGPILKEALEAIWDSGLKF